MTDFIDVLVVDDHPLFRDGLVGLLSTVSDVEVIGAVGTGDEAVRAAALDQPDVVLMDLNLPGMPGLEATRRHRHRRRARGPHPDDGR